MALWTFSAPSGASSRSPSRGQSDWSSLQSTATASPSMTTQARIRSSQALGDIYEFEQAPKLFDQLGWGYTPATEQENKFAKFDYRVQVPGKSEQLFEIKGPKRPKGLVLFEVIGISGYPGWGQGKAHYVMQFVDHTVAIVYQRQKMLDLAIEIGGPIPKSPERHPPGKFADPGVWQGRVGKSRNGLPQQDCFILLTPAQVKGLYTKLTIK